MIEAAVHGTLHLCGYDHETDNGEMLALQAKVHGVAEVSDDPTRSGFVGLAGRPNAGKSTLVNAIVGAHVAIVSERPQTTRRAIRGVATDAEAGWQLVLTDLPGVQRPRDVLTERMQRRVERELADSDVVLFVVNGQEGIGPGDRFISKALLSANLDTPVLCAVNKVDRINNAELAAVLTEAAELDGVDEVFPISARDGTGLEPLIERLTELIPEGHFMYPPEQRSDQASEVLLAELVREQVLRRTRDELPHAVEVEVTEVERARRRPHRGPRPGLGRDRVPEGDPDRQGRLEDQGDRQRRPPRARDRARRQGLPRPQGPRPRQVAPRRGPARPDRDRVAT